MFLDTAYSVLGRTVTAYGVLRMVVIIVRIRTNYPAILSSSPKQEKPASTAEQSR